MLTSVRSLLPALLVLAACSSASAPAARPSERVVVAGVPLQVEVADTDTGRSDGLRGRTDVPPGTGMVFRYGSARSVRYTMSRVDPPLVAVFVRDGRVVSVSQMAPCAGTVAQCPTYGPDEPVDTVIEAAPGSLPDVRPGDAVG